ncbi:MAG: hypothetical protein RQ757_04825 [Pseudomonadales bacterium]|nr:hypothetical protein [Pseudomonadales bacterium]
MTNSQQGWIKPAKTLLTTIAFTAIASLVPQAGLAQAGDKIRQEYPQLADLFNAFDITQAQTFEAIATINADPAYKTVRAGVREHLEMMKRMTMSEMMASGMMNHGGMNMTMSMNAASGPYPDMEVEARIKLLAVMRARHADEEAAKAYVNNAAINRHTSVVLRRGRNFENKLFEIYMDNSINNKQQAVQAAIADYLSDDRHSVSSSPKAGEFLLEHDQATGFKTAFPRLSGLMWTQQWLQLAALEAVILETLDKQFTNSMDTVLERFWSKIGTDGGMSMFPPPSELPMAPAIAPDLYTQAPEAAIILDNLNILETVVADILSYPNEEDRETKMDAAVALFTSKEADNSHAADYLLFALRGGIYNQGGPAIGKLTRSERNRSRDAMDMQHTSTMGTGQ